MNAPSTVVVVGLGEVGRPLLELVARHHPVVGIDVSPPARAVGDVAVMHVCYPFEIDDFVGVTAGYVDRFQPDLTIVNSTVAIGTTRAVADRTGAPVVHSPVRGKHARMLEDLSRYRKFVGASDPVAAKCAAEHFESLGLQTTILSSPEATELAKLTETTYFGLMIAWAQEVERYCDQLGADYDEVVTFYEEIKFLPPVKYIPGVIGGHCVMPNIDILRRARRSVLLEAIQASNAMKTARDGSSARADGSSARAAA